MSEENQDNVEMGEDQDFGGRRKKKYQRHTKKRQRKNVVIVGKVYADWCGHCQSLKPEWAKMKKHIHKKRGKRHVIYEEIEEKHIGEKLKKLNESQHVNIEANGYPTVFRVSNGKVDYYNGNRQSHAMADWFLRGGDSQQQQQMPELLQDQQGGRRNGFVRLHGTKRRNGFVRLHGTKRSRYHNNHFQRTRKQFSNKSPGILDLIFGK